MGAMIAALTGAVSVSARASGYPVVYSFASGVVAETTRPQSSPPGANNWSCRPSAAHPYPVVLIHGTVFDMTLSWQALSPLLVNAGWCVFALNYGGSFAANPVQGTETVETSAGELADFIQRIRTATGAAQVDLVGHSQGGGVLPRYYLSVLGGAPFVHQLIGLAPSNHGTDVDHFITLLNVVPGGSTLAFGPWCPACVEQFTGSAFLQRLNASGDTVPGVAYTVIESRDDEIVTPYQTAFLNGPNVTNITLQDQCALDSVDHIAITYDHIALQDVVNALDPAHARQPACSPVVALVGG
jgi:triacylglycerol esterase/lipase EstA (alpha/beta hydrolase family)